MTGAAGPPRPPRGDEPPGVPADAGGGGPWADERFPPDPARIAAGWEHRFVAFGARADEMIALYRELGYEVVADPVRTEGLDEGCADCGLIASLGFRTIYTRRPRP